MLKENIHKSDYDFLYKKYEELYSKKFMWADEILLESLIKNHINDVIDNIDEEEYLNEKMTDIELT
tara:strand:+ start:1094 stop:1291 length:198 start_codon:yes stop_codon:yes gene_type:complete